MLPFKTFATELEDNLDVFDSLIYKLIDETKEKIKNKKKEGSMLEFMIESHLGEDPSTKLTFQELKDNIAVFFVAGHET